MKKKSVVFLIGSTILMVLSIVMVGGCSLLDKYSNRWDFDREEVAEAIVDKDAGDLYELMSPYMLEENDLTEDDLQEFLDKCDIENTSSKDMDRYTSFKFLGDPSDPEGNSYRPDGNEFIYTMYYVNDDGARIFVSGILYDSKDKDKVGIYYIEYLEKDPETGEYMSVEEFGEER
ncbi:MAG: DUF5104 domain-containing protein [Clostridiales bacterium]|nr:DUF5104 domain-containing protein [Clostridiales bacterium]